MTFEIIAENFILQMMISDKGSGYSGASEDLKN